MATQILASGTTDASSSDITLADGASTTIIARGNGVGLIEARASDASYVTIGQIGADRDKAVAVTGPLIFRVRRPAGTAVAFDRE
jgi:hypothetical protein